MNQILSEDEAYSLAMSTGAQPIGSEFVRQVEQAILAKMNSAEPVAYGWFEDGDMKAMSFCDIPYTPQFSPNAIKTPLFTHPAPSAVEEQPQFVVELPDGDDREAKVWWSEKRADGKWRISVTVAAARSE